MKKFIKEHGLSVFCFVVIFVCIFVISPFGSFLVSLIKSLAAKVYKPISILFARNSPDSQIFHFFGECGFYLTLLFR